MAIFASGGPPQEGRQKRKAKKGKAGAVGGGAAVEQRPQDGGHGAKQKSKKGGGVGSRTIVTGLLTAVGLIGFSGFMWTIRFVIFWHDTIFVFTKLALTICKTLSKSAVTWKKE